MTVYSMDSNALLGRKAIQKLLAMVLDKMHGDQNEVIFFARKRGLTRFSKFGISQNVYECESALRVRTAVGQRIGTASTNVLTPAGFLQVAENAALNAKLHEEDAAFISFVEKQEIPEIKSFYDSTAAYATNDRLNAVRKIYDVAGGSLEASGHFTTEIDEIAIMNSLGFFAYLPVTTAETEVFMNTSTSSGYAGFYSPDVRKIDVDEIATTAAKKAIDGQSPVRIEPGRYPVVLESSAVAALMEFVAAQGFSGPVYQAGKTTFKPGDRMASELVTLTDNAASNRGIPIPFDCEGYVRKPVNLITNGVAGDMVYDAESARKFGCANTGHGLSVPNKIWPVAPHIAANCQPMHMFLEPGEAKPSELTKGIKRGLLVTHLHYNRLVHPVGAVVQGTTRGGTFLIEDGEVTRPVQNMRYTQGVIESLRSVSGVGDETFLHRSTFGTYSVPALRLDDFNFVSVAAAI